MTKYIALLRSINVGGKNIIKMADLKDELSKMGLDKVQTHTKSGNVLFESQKNENLLKDEIEQVIYESFGYYIPIVLRNFEEIRQIINQFSLHENRFNTIQKSKKKHTYYVALLDTSLMEKEIRRLHEINVEDEFFILMEKEIYLSLGKAVPHSRLMNFLQRTQTVNVIRNWLTIKRLLSFGENINQI